LIFQYHKLKIDLFYEALAPVFHSSRRLLRRMESRKLLPRNLEILLLLQPFSECANIYSVNCLLKVATIDNAQDNHLLLVRPEYRPKISGLDLPVVLTAKPLDLAGRPGRGFREFQVIENLEGIALLQLEKVPLCTRRVGKLSFIHGGVRFAFLCFRDQFRLSSRIRGARLRLL